MQKLHRQNQDADPKASAVCLAAYAQFLKGSPKTISDDIEFWKGIDKDYINYISLGGHAPGFKLSPEEEIALIKNLMKYAENKDFQSGYFASARLHFLVSNTPEQISRLVIPEMTSPSQESQYRPTFTKDDFAEMAYYATAPPENEPELITRPGKSIEKDIAALYVLAKRQSPDLHLKLEFASRDINANKLVVNLLKAIQSQPYKFPEPDEFINICAGNDWFNFSEKIVKPFSEFYASETKASSSKQPESFDMTSLKVQEKEAPKVEKLEIKITLPKRSVKILTTKQLNQYFKPSNLPGGITLTPQEVQELKEAVDLPGEKGIGKVKSKALQKDIDDFSKTPVKQRYELASEKAYVLKTRLMVQQAEEQKHLLVDLKSILNKANTLPSGVEVSSIKGLELLGGVKKEVTLEDLVIGLITKDAGKLLEKNPALNSQSVKEIFDDLAAFYDRATRLQKVERSLALVDDIEKRKAVLKPPATVSEDQLYLNLSEKLYDELERQRAFKIDENPKYLILEYFQNLLMFQSQADDLNKMVNPVGNPNKILQKIMASGKTKLFLPVLALKKADGDSLSVIVVPASQYETSLKEMNALSGQGFHQVTHTLTFDRNSKFSVDDLRALNKKLDTIRERKEYLVMTSKSLLCLHLKCLEMWHDYLEAPAPSPGMEEALIEMAKVLNTFKTKGKATLDEADLLLMNTQEVIFTLGKPEDLMKGHADRRGYLREHRPRHFSERIHSWKQ